MGTVFSLIEMTIFMKWTTIPGIECIELYRCILKHSTQLFIRIETIRSAIEARAIEDFNKSHVGMRKI